MTTVTDKVNAVRSEMDDARIGKARRETIEYALRGVLHTAGSLPVGSDNVPSPHVDPDSYAGRYYWQGKDRAEARDEQPADVKVRAVNIDHMSEHDLRESRSPGGWLPRVEVKMTALDRTLVGDLSPREARTLAMALLAAAETVDR